MTRERSLPLITNPVARRLLLSGAGMLERPKGRCTTRTVKDIIQALGYVQLDSIYRVERAHHSILFSRTSSYKQTYLKRLLERERSVFENWTHDAAIIPIEFFPYWQRHFVRFAPYLWKRWHAANRLQHIADLERIKTHIANHGPVLARDLAPQTDAKRNGWWDWHPSKAALEFLWRTGELAVTRRDGFQKVYDLTENVIPAAFRTGPVASEQFVDWLCCAALDRLRLATCRDIADFWGLVSTREVMDWLGRQPADQFRRVRIETAHGPSSTDYICSADTLLELEDVSAPTKRLRILNPFDPLIRNRRRLSRIFGFEYRIEVFVPKARRQYGYYVFPLIEGETFVGRVDLVHDREEDALRVNGLWWEPRVRATRARLKALESQLNRLRQFVGASRVVFAPDQIVSDQWHPGA